MKEPGDPVSPAVCPAGKPDAISTESVCPGDNPPTVSISPSSGAVTSGTVAVTVTYTDDVGLITGSASITLNGVTVTSLFTHSGSTFSWQSRGTITLNPGSNTLTARIDDRGGNSGFRTVTYTYDASPPAVGISPSGGTFSTPGVGVTVSWSDDGTLNAASRSITINGTNVTSSFGYSGSASSATSSGSVGLGVGANTFTASICDNAGRCSSNSATYTFSPPPPSITITAGTRSGSSQPFTIDWSDNAGLDADSRSITWNGTNVTGNFSYFPTLESGIQSQGTVTLQPGNNVLTARICNVYGACNSSDYFVTYDASPPFITMSPSGAWTNTQSFPLTVDWCDDASLNSGTRSIVRVRDDLPDFPSDLTTAMGYTPGSRSGCGSFAQSAGTVTLDPGGNTINTRICDFSGNCSSTSGYYIYDNSAPFVGISPASGAFTSASRPVTVTWSDDRALNAGTRTLTLNGAGVGDSYSGSSTSATSTLTLTLAAGRNTFVARICDVAGNCNSSSATYDLDVTQPSVAFSPSGGTFAASSRPLTISWSDNLSLNGASRTLTLNGAAVTTSYTASSATAATSTATLTLVAGSNTVVARICDVAGNCGSSSTTYVFDGVAPTVSVAPGTSTVTSASRSVTVTWGDNLGLDLASRTITLNGASVLGSFTHSEGGTSATSTGTVTLANGANTLTARICDNGGSCTSSSAIYTLDASPPTVAFNPVSGTVVAAGSITATVTWTDNTSLSGASRSFTLNSSPVSGDFAFNAGSSTVATSRVGLGLSVGANTFSARICDGAGNCTTGSATYTFDPPPPSVTITAGTRSGSSQPFTIDWSDNAGLNANSRVITWNGTDVTTSFNYMPGPDVAIQSTGTVTLRGGSNTLIARICNNYNVCATSEYPIIYDAAPPTITLNPSGGWFNTASLPLTVDWCDDVSLNPNSRSVTRAAAAIPELPAENVPLGYTPGSRAGCGSFAQSSGTLSLYPGENTVTARICDTTGNCTPTTGDFIYDNVAPSVTLNPANGAFTVASRSVTVTWGDDRILNAGSRSITLNGSPVTDAFNSTSSTSATSTLTLTLAEGRNTVVARICDVAGNCTQNSAIYDFDTVLPTVAIAPAAGTFAAASRAVTITWRDNLSLNGGSRTVTLNGGSVTVGYAASSPTEATSSFTVNLVAGSNTLVGRICDAANNCGSSSAPYVFDAVAPTVAVAPESGTFNAASRAVTVTWGDNTGLDLATRTITLNGTSVDASFTHAGGGTSATSTGTVTLADGANTLTARICDNAGTCTPRSATYTLDATAPVVAISPPNGSVFSASGLQATVTWSDNLSLDGVSRTFTLNDAPATGDFTFNPGSTTGATSRVSLTLRPGANTFTARICDAAVNCQTGSATYTYNPQPPVVTITSGTRNGASQPITIRWEDDVGLDGPTHKITWNDADVTTSFSYALDDLLPGGAAMRSEGMVTLREGPNTLLAYVCDVEGACTTAPWSFEFDGSAPTIALTPAGGTFPGGSIGVTVSWCDNGTLNPTSRSIVKAWSEAPPLSVEITSDFSYEAAMAAGCNDAAQSTGTLTLEPGPVNLAASICDVSGNCETRTVTFTRDGAAPLVRVTPVPLSPAEPLATVQQTFLVENADAVSRTMRLSVDCTEPLSACSVPATVTIASGATATVLVSVRAGGSDTEGEITLTADNQTGGPAALGMGRTSLAAKSYRVAITPRNTKVTKTPSVTTSQSFVVTNIGAFRASYKITVTCTVITNCSKGTTLTLDPKASQTLTISYRPGAHGTKGRLSVAAAYSTDLVARDSAIVSVTARDLTRPWVVVSDLNPGTSIERDLCVNISAGPAAAYECGDLRVVHPLPTVRTMNKGRTPTLLYSSATAYGRALLAAEVTLPAGSAIPDSITACATLSNGSKPCGQWAGTTFTPGSTQRITLWVSGSTFAGPRVYGAVYGYTFEVRQWRTGTTTTVLASQTGELAMVDRKDSPFGRGWWIAGVEQLFFLANSRILWVGGDGSTRVYAPSGTNRWVAPNLDRADVLTRDATSYTRELPNGLRVKFDLNGLHRQTINRLAHTTIFDYDASSRLGAITVPVPAVGSAGVDGSAAAPMLYTFDYATPDQVKVTAPKDAEDRVTTLSISGGLLRSITDPDTKTVGYEYHPTIAGLMMARTDKMLRRRSFDWGAGNVLKEVRMPMGGSNPDIVTLITAAEAVALNQGAARTLAVPAESAYTLVNGPRRDTTVTRFWVNGQGAPRRIKNAVGDTTVMSRDDLRWPALVTRVRHPSGQVVGAEYDGRGNLLSSTDSSTFRDLAPSGRKYATTAYRWDEKWDMATRVTQPEGEVTSYIYERTMGNRLSVQPGPDASRRTTFAYYPGTALFRSTKVPLSQQPESVYYDARGNLKASKTSLGFWTFYEKDLLGRDRLVRSPIDVAGRAQVHESTIYDINDRPKHSVSFGPDTGGPTAQKLVVDRFYDDEGNLERLERQSLMGAATGIGIIVTRWRYDAANRQVAEVSPNGTPSGVVDSTTYDAAGNAVEKIPRRGVAQKITMTYDALNRMTERVLPSVSYSERDEGIAAHPLHGRDEEFNPAYAAGGLTLDGDSDVFTYDATGMRTANNSSAQVAREYNVNGSLKTETQRIRTIADGAGAFDKHSYTVKYQYDLNGRRTSLWHPPELLPWGSGEVRYAYDPATGALSSVTDLLGKEFRYVFDARGDLRNMYLPGGVIETYVNDDDGRLRYHTVGTAAAPSLTRNMAFTYDARGLVLTSTSTRGAMETLTATYTGLGHLATDRVRWRGKPDGGDAMATITSTEYFTLDALGNKQSDLSTTHFDPDVGPDFSRGVSNSSWVYEPGTGRLARGEPAGAILYNDTTRYDEAGNAQFTWQIYDPRAIPALQDRASYYASDNTLRMSDFRIVLPWDGQYFPRWRVVETYRYDALGRRVLVLTDRWCDGHALPAECNLDLVRRIVWDGMQELDEIQMPEAGAEKDVETHELPSTNPDLNPYVGRVLYTHGLETDRPLSVTRVNYQDHKGGYGYQVFPAFTIVPLWNSRGQADHGYFNDGKPSVCIGSSGQCVFWFLEAGWRGYNKARPLNLAWHGSLLEDKQDKTGTFYRRARQYDPATGRFTQEDPIGLAGGLNLYGYAGGNPLTYSDPFGLCKKPKGMKKGEVGICIESFIARSHRGVPRWAADKRTFSATGGSYKTSDRFTVDPKTGAVSKGDQDSGNTGVVPGIGSQRHTGTSNGAGTTINASGWGRTLSPWPPFNIDYQFTLSVSRGGSVELGRYSHDGFPSFEIWVYQEGKDPLLLHKYDEGNVGQLVGCCDVKKP